MPRVCRVYRVYRVWLFRLNRVNRVYRVYRVYMVYGPRTCPQSSPPFPSETGPSPTNIGTGRQKKAWRRPKISLTLALRPLFPVAPTRLDPKTLLEGSWYLVTNYNCTYNCTYNHTRAVRGLISTVIITVIVGE